MINRVQSEDAKGWWRENDNSGETLLLQQSPWCSNTANIKQLYWYYYEK